MSIGRSRWGSPTDAVISILETCDFKCRMCSIRSGPKLDADVLSRLPRSLTNVTLTGGEPFLLADLPVYVARVAARLPGVRIVIVTNGGRPSRIYGVVSACHPRPAIRVSIDAIGALHDEIRGVPHAYERAVETLQAVRPLVRDLGISMTVSDYNVDQIDGVHALAERLGCTFSLQVVHNSSLFYKTVANPSLTRLTEFEAAVRRVRPNPLTHWPPHHAVARNLYLAFLVDYANGRPRRLFCDAGGTFIYVGVDGNVYPCLLLDHAHSMGNLRSHSWEAIVEGAAASRERGFVPSCPIQCCQTCTVAPVLKSNVLRLVPLGIRTVIGNLWQG